jgi:hypothetical protein
MCWDDYTLYDTEKNVLQVSLSVFLSPVQNFVRSDVFNELHSRREQKRM